MYEKFFSLAHRPFAAAPNLECIVAHEGYVQARERLLRCLTDGCGLAVLTAPPGLGKSLLCQDLQSRLRGLFTVAYLCSAQFPNRKAMLQAILFELGADYLGLSEDEARLCVMQAALEAATRGRSLIVIVDEAHLVSTELLQELRTLAEPSPRCANPVRLMLAGQLELEERLADPELESLNQRVACHAILESLSQADAAEYIHERLAIAGAKTQAFSEEALAFIVRAADGNPRAIHQLCDHCLLSAYTIEEKPISLETARNSLDDLRALPLHWNDAGLLEESGEAVDDSLEELADDEFVSTVGPIDEAGSNHEPAATEELSEMTDPGPLWGDSPNLGVIEVGGEMDQFEAAPTAIAEEAIADEAIEDDEAFAEAADIEVETVAHEAAQEQFVDASFVDASSADEPIAEEPISPLAESASDEAGSLSTLTATTDEESTVVDENPISEAALFASVAPWPAVPVAFGESFGERLDGDLTEESANVDAATAEAMPELAAFDINSAPEALESNPAVEEATLSASTDDADEAAAFEEDDLALEDVGQLSQELEAELEAELSAELEAEAELKAALEAQLAEEEDDFAIEPTWAKQVELIDELEADDFEDEDLVVDDRYAALDRASETLATAFPKAPELLQFLSQYAMKQEPRRGREVATSMHQSAVVAEPEVETHEEELLATIRGLQEQLRQAAVDRPRRTELSEPWQQALEYDIVEPPTEIIESAAPVDAPADPITEPELVATAPKPEPAKSRFAQLFSRMRQRRREVEDRLQKNSDWI
ncbi:MAG TPA: AAA family ATPase [Caulifigura sp.]|nr:AAA family ATPase [Caulifigura sp.]